MKKVLAPGLFALIALILAFGLLYTADKNLKIAPELSSAAQGRLHAHAKNATWLGGEPERVGDAVAGAVLPDDPDALQALPREWRARILALTPEPAAQHDYLVILPGAGEDAMAWALPGAYWAVYARAPVLFAGRDGLAPDDLELAAGLGLPVYLLAPEHLVSGEVAGQLGGRVPLRRIAGGDPESHALELARFRDEETGFGWGRVYEERYGYFHYVIASLSDTDSALAALPLAYTNAATLLFATPAGGFSPRLDNYLWQQRSDWFTTPSEGPFRHFWIAGDGLSYAALARADLAVEKADYPARGPAALGPLDAAAIAFLSLGAAGALLVLFHSRRFAPEVMMGMRIAWTGTALVLPVLGVWLYLAANDPLPDKRTQAQQTAAATAMGFGYGAPLMIAIGYGFVWFGMPNFYGEWTGGPLYLLGSGMLLMMIAMYVFAVLLAGPLAQFPMRSMMKKKMSDRAVFWMSMKVTALSMAAVSLGMMSMTWWTFKYHLPMMPKEDEILWFGVMWLASSVGFLAAWPLNWPMITRGLKMGSM